MSPSHDSCCPPVNSLQLQISQKHNDHDGAHLSTSSERRSKLTSNANLWYKTILSLGAMPQGNRHNDYQLFVPCCDCEDDNAPFKSGY